MAAVMCNSYGYTKLEKEDSEERKHREAQFLIYKTLEEVDKMISSNSSSSSSRRRRPSWFRLRIRKLKIKVGKRLKSMRKTMVMSMSKARLYRNNLVSYLKTWRRLFHHGEAATTPRLPEPIFGS
ncbi:hypothetical protein Dimus_032937 [Dionaea muscipula]